METPPESPAPQPPLGRRFALTLLAPVAFMALSFLTISARSQGVSSIAVVALWGAAISTFVCSVVLGVQLGRRFGKTDGGRIGMGFVMFLALQTFYFVCFFIGCTATISLT